MRKLATIETIREIKIHPNADALELAMVRGWQCVVKKNEFKAGDLCVYVEIDSVLPEREEFEFMRPRNFRVRTAKFRNELSQGIVFPLSVCDKFEHVGNLDFEVGDDVTELIDIKLYAPPVPACLAGDVEGKFPALIPKTDCERIQNHQWLIEQLGDIKWMATEKLDGSSVTLWYEDGMHVCSRNWELKETDNNAYWLAVRRMGIEDKIKDYKIALQGELLGPKIQGNRYGLSDYQIYFFDAWHMLHNRYLSVHEFFNMCKELGLPTVPRFMEFQGLPNMERLLTLAELKSALNHKVEQEGLVFKPLLEAYDQRMGRVAFKAISNKFLLREKD